LNESKDKCIPLPGEVVLFPILILTVAFLIVAGVGCFFSKKQQFYTTALMLLGLLEFLAYIV
jgi:hypothetical protein